MRMISRGFKQKQLRSLDSYHRRNPIQVIAQKIRKFEEFFPPICKRLFSQVEDSEPRLKKGSPYGKWFDLCDFFERYGITSFKTSDVAKMRTKNEVYLELGNERTA